jgi:hypothetical protein
MSKNFNQIFKTIICYNGNFSYILPKSTKNLIINSKKSVYAKKKYMYIVAYICIFQILGCLIIHCLLFRYNYLSLY